MLSDSFMKNWFLFFFLFFLLLFRNCRSKAWRPEKSGRTPPPSPLHPTLHTAPQNNSAGTHQHTNLRIRLPWPQNGINPDKSICLTHFLCVCIGAGSVVQVQRSALAPPTAVWTWEMHQQGEWEVRSNGGACLGLGHSSRSRPLTWDQTLPQQVNDITSLCCPILQQKVIEHWFVVCEQSHKRPLSSDAQNSHTLINTLLLFFFSLVHW